MTVCKERKRNPVLPISGFLLLCALLIFSRDVIPWVQHGILLCGKTIIPTLFPCMIACDMLSSGAVMTSGRSTLDKACRFLFGVPFLGMSAFFLGAICGFPIGTKIAADLYRNKKIDQKELACLLSFSNVTGPVFLVAGVGISLFGSLKTGLFFYMIQVISALLCGLLAARIPRKATDTSYQAPLRTDTQDFHVSTSVSKNAVSLLTVCGFVLLFSAICGILSSFIKNEALLTFIYSFLEVGGACAQAASLLQAMPRFSILCATLAVNFSGMSVHLQAASFLSGIPFSFGRYILIKVMQAAFAILLSVIFFPLMGFGT